MGLESGPEFGGLPNLHSKTENPAQSDREFAKKRDRGSRRGGGGEDDDSQRGKSQKGQGSRRSGGIEPQEELAQLKADLEAQEERERLDREQQHITPQTPDQPPAAPETPVQPTAPETQTPPTAAPEAPAPQPPVTTETTPTQPPAAPVEGGETTTAPPGAEVPAQTNVPVVAETPVPPIETPSPPVEATPEQQQHVNDYLAAYQEEVKPPSAQTQATEANGQPDQLETETPAKEATGASPKFWQDAERLRLLKELPERTPEQQNQIEELERLIESQAPKNEGETQATEVAKTLEEDKRYKDLVEKHSLEYLQTQDAIYYNMNFSGVAPSGYLLDREGKETNTLPSQNVNQGFDEVKAKAESEFASLYPEDSARYKEQKAAQAQGEKGGELDPLIKATAEKYGLDPEEFAKLSTEERAKAVTERINLEQQAQVALEQKALAVEAEKYGYTPENWSALSADERENIKTQKSDEEAERQRVAGGGVGAENGGVPPVANGTENDGTEEDPLKSALKSMIEKAERNPFARGAEAGKDFEPMSEKDFQNYAGYRDLFLRLFGKELDTEKDAGLIKAMAAYRSQSDIKELKDQVNVILVMTEIRDRLGVEPPDVARIKGAVNGEGFEELQEMMKKLNWKDEVDDMQELLEKMQNQVRGIRGNALTRFLTFQDENSRQILDRILADPKFMSARSFLNQEGSLTISQILEKNLQGDIRATLAEAAERTAKPTEEQEKPSFILELLKDNDGKFSEEKFLALIPLLLDQARSEGLIKEDVTLTSFWDTVKQFGGKFMTSKAGIGLAAFLFLCFYIPGAATLSIAKQK